MANTRQAEFIAAQDKAYARSQRIALRLATQRMIASQSYRGSSFVVTVDSDGYASLLDYRSHGYGAKLATFNGTDMVHVSDSAIGDQSLQNVVSDTLLLHGYGLSLDDSSGGWTAWYG